MKQRLEYIDALRGLAALMVLICHSLQIDETLIIPEGLSNCIESGKYGVQLFFILSALTMFYSLTSNDSNSFNFFIRRFFRIAPLYFIAVIFYSYLFDSSTKGVFFNLTFLHGFSPYYINSVVPGGWSIGVEMVFYLLVPFLFRHIDSFNKALYLFFLTLILSFVFLYVYKKVFISTSENESFIYFWLPNQFPVFALGFITYFITFQRSKINLKDVYVPLLCIISLFVFGLVTKLAIFRDHILIAISFAFLVFIFSQRTFSAVVNKGTLFVGKISYSFYLSQYAVMELLKRRRWYNFIPNRNALLNFINISVNFALFLIITSLASYVLFKFIELPFQKIGRNIIHKRIKHSDRLNPIFESIADVNRRNIRK